LKSPDRALPIFCDDYILCALQAGRSIAAQALLRSELIRAMTELALKNTHAVVTGGGRGIGAAIVRRLAQDGANITLISRSSDELQAVQRELEDQFPQKFLSLTVDVTAPDLVKDAFEQCRDTLKEPQILVNNAGSADSIPFVKADLDHWDSTINVNLRAVYLCIHQVLPSMIKAGYGRIVTIASTAGLTGYPYIAAYCAAKHGAVGLTRALALETAAQGITVNAVCPGFTETDLLKNAFENVAQKTARSSDEIREEFLKNVPQGRFVQPDEIASAVAWLCRKEQSSITGQTITIAGGEVI